MKRMLVVVLSMGALGCVSLKPVPVALGDRCTRCNRVITDVRLAGEIITDNGEILLASKFKAPGCMAMYLAETPQKVRAVFVTDYTTRRLIRAENASFVRFQVAPPANEMDYAAFIRLSEAIEFGKPINTLPVDWLAVRREAEARTKMALH